MKPVAFLSASALLELNLTPAAAGSVLWTVQSGQTRSTMRQDRTSAGLFELVTGCRSS